MILLFYLIGLLLGLIWGYFLCQDRINDLQNMNVELFTKYITSKYCKED